MKTPLFSHPCLDEVKGVDIARRWMLFRRCGRFGQPRLSRYNSKAFGGRGWELDLWPFPLMVWRAYGRLHMSVGKYCFLPHSHGSAR